MAVVKQVTGDGELLGDSVNGDYQLGDGDYNGQPYYIRVDLGYHIFYWSDTGQWRIAAELGDETSYFHKTGDVNGTYTPGPNCTGNPLVAPASVVVLERFDSRATETGSGASVELTYTVTGTADDAEAVAAVLAEAPESYGNLSRTRVSLEPVHVDEENPDDCVWTGTVEYTRPENERQTPETGDSSFSFDTGGGTQHITQSLETVGKYAASGEAPDFGGAIGVTHDNVEGVDIIVPVYNFAETHYLADEMVTNAYKGKLFHLTGKVNNGSFKGLDEGECLFLGASGSKRGSGADWEITFRFAGSENKTDLTVGAITGVNKKGWEYMWVRYQDVTEDSPGLVAPMVVKQPIAVYVEKVYEYGNFADLGIGT